MTCPGCDSRTSSVLAAFRNGEPCPYCGLSTRAAAEIEHIRESKANVEIKQMAEEATKRAETAEHQVRILRYRIGRIESALNEEPPQW